MNHCKALYSFLSKKMEEFDLEQTPSSTQRDLSEVAVRLKASRSGKMAHLTRRMNIVNSFMNDAEYLEEVKGNMLKFNEMLDEFNTLQESYVQMLSCEDKVEDLKGWYEPRMKQVDVFVFYCRQVDFYC